MKTTLFIIFTLISELLFGQTSIFKWEDETCSYKSIYNIKLYTEIQISNSYKLTYKDEYSFRSIIVIINKIEEVEKIHMDLLENEYQYKRNIIISMDLPKKQYWENLRKIKLAELDQYYKLQKIKILSFSDPKYLRQFKQTDSCILKHSNALIAGGDSLLNDWHDLTSQLAMNNGSPEKVWEDYYIQLNSKDKYNYARITVTKFGWWNCANRFINYVDNFIDDETQKTEFLKLFIKTKTIECVDTN